MPKFKSLAAAAAHCDAARCPYSWVHELPGGGYDVHRPKRGDEADQGDDLDVPIEYGVIENKREGGGWLPRIWVRGEGRGDTWAAAGFDRTDALVYAKAQAEQEAEQWIGDYRTTIKMKASATRAVKTRAPKLAKAKHKIKGLTYTLTQMGELNDERWLVSRGPRELGFVYAGNYDWDAFTPSDLYISTSKTRRAAVAAVVARDKRG